MNGSGKSKNDDSIKKREMRGHINAYLLRNRGRQQYRHAPRASQATYKIMRPLAKKFGAGLTALRSHWPEIVGEKWAALSEPATLRGSKDDKVLVIKAKGPAAALISASSDQLLAKINQYLGANSVSKLKIIQSQIIHKNPVKASPTRSKNNVYSSVAQTGENALQAALDKLGKNINARNP